jgi:hypothetical protein
MKIEITKTQKGIETKYGLKITAAKSGAYPSHVELLQMLHNGFEMIIGEVEREHQQLINQIDRMRNEKI